MGEDIACDFDDGLECVTAERLLGQRGVRCKHHRQSAGSSSGRTGRRELEEFTALGFCGCIHAGLLYCLTLCRALIVMMESEWGLR